MAQRTVVSLVVNYRFDLKRLGALSCCQMAYQSPWYIRHQSTFYNVIAAVRAAECSIRLSILFVRLYPGKGNTGVTRNTPPSRSVSTRLARS